MRRRARPERAARITGFARPGTTVVSEAVVDALPEGATELSRIGTRRLKGVGPVRLFRVRAEDGD